MLRMTDVASESLCSQPELSLMLKLKLSVTKANVTLAVNYIMAAQS